MEITPPQSDRATVTILLEKHKKGDRNALQEVYKSVYDELKIIARARLRSERQDHTLQSTALVHEAFIKLIGSENPDWKNRAHFFGIASRAMKQILIDHARAKLSQKRGGEWVRVELNERDQTDNGTLNDEEILELASAIESLREKSDRQAEIVDLKFFGGLSNPEAAEVLGVSEATVKREWAVAKAYLHRELHGNA